MIVPWAMSSIILYCRSDFYFKVQTEHPGVELPEVSPRFELSIFRSNHFLHLQHLQWEYLCLWADTFCQCKLEHGKISQKWVQSKIMRIGYGKSDCCSEKGKCWAQKSPQLSPWGSLGVRQNRVMVPGKGITWCFNLTTLWLWNTVSI